MRVRGSTTARNVAVVIVVETKDCNYDVTSELVVATSTSQSSNADSDPYRREVQLQVEHVPVDGHQSMYRLFNTSRAAAPFLKFEVPHIASVVRAVYDATTVKDDATLTAELTRRTGSSGNSNWVLTVAGQLQRCPGKSTDNPPRQNSIQSKFPSCHHHCHALPRIKRIQ